MNTLSWNLKKQKDRTQFYLNQIYSLLSSIIWYEKKTNCFTFTRHFICFKLVPCSTLTHKAPKGIHTLMFTLGVILAGVHPHCIYKVYDIFSYTICCLINLPYLQALYARMASRLCHITFLCVVFEPLQ